MSLKPLYGAAATITMTLASLASDATIIAGRESTAIDNTTDLALDALVGGKIKTGTTTANKQIEIWAIGSYDGTTYAAGATGSDANFTTSVAAKKTLLKLLGVIPIPDTTARTYEWGPFSIAQAFGTMPKKWGIYIVHNSGANLDATGSNHEVKYTPVNFQNV